MRVTLEVLTQSNMRIRHVSFSRPEGRAGVDSWLRVLGRPRVLCEVRVQVRLWPCSDLPSPAPSGSEAQPANLTSRLVLRHAHLAGGKREVEGQELNDDGT